MESPSRSPPNDHQNQSISQNMAILSDPRTHPPATETTGSVSPPALAIKRDVDSVLDCAAHAAGDYSAGGSHAGGEPVLFTAAGAL